MPGKHASQIRRNFIILRFPTKWRGGRVVEGARLESVYTPQGYRGFESLSLRKANPGSSAARGIFILGASKLAWGSG